MKREIDFEKMYSCEAKIIIKDIKKYLLKLVDEGKIAKNFVKPYIKNFSLFTFRQQHLFLNSMEKSGLYKADNEEQLVKIYEECVARLPSPEQEAAMKKISELNEILTLKSLNGSITQDETDKMLSPMQELDWNGKKKLAEELIDKLSE